MKRLIVGSRGHNMLMVVVATDAEAREVCNALERLDVFHYQELHAQWRMDELVKVYFAK